MSLTRTGMKYVYGISFGQCLNSISYRSCLLPPNAFDTHVHVFDPWLGPYAASRAYTPEDAPLEKLIAFNKSISQYRHDGKNGTRSTISL